jgi:hypothetical protein
MATWNPPVYSQAQQQQQQDWSNNGGQSAQQQQQVVFKQEAFKQEPQDPLTVDHNYNGSENIPPTVSHQQHLLQPQQQHHMQHQHQMNQQQQQEQEFQHLFSPLKYVLIYIIRYRYLVNSGFVGVCYMHRTQSK